MVTRIASAEVASKLNNWYIAIRQNNLELSEQLKREIVNDFDYMEENQNVLLYYSLLDFRHKILLSFYSKKENNIEENILYLEANKEKMVGLLDYYFWFFKGMYELNQNNIIEAMASYKKAEEKLYIVDDEIEKAEFYYKLSQFYYFIKKNFLSLNYALRAQNSLFAKTYGYIE